MFDTETLGFSRDKQLAVLGHIFADKQFFMNVVPKVEADWFNEETVKQIMKVVKKRFRAEQTMPSMQAVLEDFEIVQMEPATQNALRATAAMSKSSTSIYSAASLYLEMEVWMKTRLLKMALPKAVNAYNVAKFDECASLLNKTVKDYYDANFDGDGAESFKNYYQELVDEEFDRKRALTFGIHQMDRLIDPNGAEGDGSLFRGDMTVLLAPTNVGKTSALCTIGAHNFRRGASILFLTHEGGKREIKNKIMRSMMMRNKPQLKRVYELDPANMARIEERLDMDFTYIPMNKPGLTVEEVMAVIDKFMEKRKAATGKYYDLVIDDYPAKLSTELARGGFFQKRHIDEEVYNQFVQIALRYDCHVLTAIQTNREGSKLNRRSGIYKNETRLLQMEDVMESWGPMTSAATVISMNRDEEDIRGKKLTYLLCKSRSGETGWAMVVNTDYDACVVHSEQLGYFWYRGERNISDQSVGLMSAYRNREVTKDAFERFESAGQA